MLQAGDRILGFDVNRGCVAEGHVLSVLHHKEGPYTMNVLTHSEQSPIAVTDGHPLYNGVEWVDSNDLAKRPFLHFAQIGTSTCSFHSHVETESTVLNIETSVKTYLVGELGLVACGAVSKETPDANFIAEKR